MDTKTNVNPPDTEPTGPMPLPEKVPVEVGALFEKFAIDLWNRGFTRYSSDAILHRIRWHYHVDIGDRSFKCNDNWTSKLARWFLSRHPEMSGFFELRRSPNRQNKD